MAAKETLDAIEKNLDVIEDKLDVIEGVQEVFRFTGKHVTSALIIGAIGGAAASYFLTKRALKTKYEELASIEIEEAKEFYQRHYKAGDFESVTTTRNALVGPAADALESYQTGEPVEAVETEAREENVFQTHLTEGNWDQEHEEKYRASLDAGVPFIIHHDEYMEGEHNYRQVTLTYFLGDDVLVDEQDRPIDDIDKTVGEQNITRFGHGSKDNKIVYIRNDRLSLDFEVVSDENSYTEKVLGLQHSDEPRARKFRDADE